MNNPNFGIDLNDKLERRILTPISIDQFGTYRVEISDSIFEKNNASVGAGLAVEGVSLLIYNSAFISNNAKYAAGGLFFNNTKDFSVTGYDKNINITMYNTIF